MLSYNHMQEARQKVRQPALSIANFFGAFGYIAIILLWLWVGGLLLYPSIQNGSFDWLGPQPSSTTPAPVLPHSPSTGVSMVVGVIVLILCLVVMAYSVYAIPKSIGKAGAKATRGAAESLVPVATHHKPISKKAKRTLTARMVLGIKIMAILLPLIAVAITPSFAVLDKQIIVVTTLVIAVYGLLNYLVQYALAMASKLDPSALW